jgi:mRNA interferase MazF
VKRGDVVLVDVPFTDYTGSKVRPALVVSSSGVNRAGDCILVPISSNVSNPSPWDVLAYPTDAEFKATGLHRSSAFKCGKLVTLSANLIKRRLGAAGSGYLAQVAGRIKDALDIR